MRSRVLLRYPLILLLVSSLFSATLAPVEAARRARPGGPVARRGAPAAAHRAVPQRVPGRATYGYGRFRPGGFYPYRRHHAYFDLGFYGFYGFYGWGWPYAHVGWYPAPYAPVPYVLGEVEIGEKPPAIVETDIRPRKATVRLDGEIVGDAKDYDGRWDRLELAPGTHVLEFEAPGYQTLRTRLQARQGSYYRIEEHLSKGEGLDPRSSTEGNADVLAETAAPSAVAPEKLTPGFLDIVADPPDAAVYLDGEFLARAEELSALHGAIAVARGRHRIEVVRPGYRSESAEVEVEATVRIKVELRLESSE